MSGLSLAIARLERLGDYCNAILVKEARQALKSRQFAGTFLLLLLACWTGSLFGVSYQAESIEYGSSAQTFFNGFFFVLCMATLVIVPFSAFRSVVEERSENTLELVQITTLSPKQIVRGKVASALMQVLVYYCAIAPFIAFTSLLPGFDLPHVVFSLAMLFIASLCFTTITLATGAQARSKASQAFSTLGIICLCGGGAMGFFSLLLATSSEIRFDRPGFWWFLCAILFGALSTAYLCQQIAVAQFTFESDNRSSGIRVMVVVQWLVLWLILIAFTAISKPSPMPTDALEVLVTCTAVYIGGASLFFASEPDPLSRRVGRSIPRRRWLRDLWIPFLPGGARGLLYGLWSLGVFSVVVMGFLFVQRSMGASFSWNFFTYARGLLWYIVIYLGAGTFFARFLRRSMRSVVAAHIYILLSLITAILATISVGTQFYFRLKDSTRLFVNLLNPFSTLEIMESNRDGGIGFCELWLIVGAVLAIAVNGRAIHRAVTEVIHQPVRAPQQRRATVPQPVGIPEMPSSAETLAGSDAVSSLPS